MKYLKSIYTFLLLSGVGYTKPAPLEKEDFIRADTFTQAVSYAAKTYVPLITELSSGRSSVNRADIMKAFRRDPLMRESETKSGHTKFVCTEMKFTFCVIGHGSEEIESPKERKDFQNDIQEYINAINNFYIKNHTTLAYALKTTTETERGCSAYALERASKTASEDSPKRRKIR